MNRVVYLLPLLLCILYVHNVESDNHFTNEWVAEVKGGLDHARQVAQEHGYRVVRELIGFPDHYKLIHKDVPNRSRRSADHHTRRLTGDHRVNWASQQEEKTRKKRGYKLDERSSEDRIYRQIQDHINDPKFKKEWYLIDSRKDLSESKKDLHVLPLWNKGITGKGVTVTILDDGIEHTHDDLIQNYAPYASYDLNDDDHDPMPRYESTNENKHGTRCAGEVSMAPNNDICGVGVAFNARIGGIRMLDGRVTDSLEGEAIMYNATYVDIYSASWGPNDDGRTVEGPGPLAKHAFVHGVTHGRHGKGSIYVWASGNGGGLGDNCNCDGYTGSRYSISISSASQGFQVPWYGERCASTMATTYSSGGPHDQKVVSTDLHNKCTDMHTGTSAAAPMAAGIFALLLEANPDLTWRDVQHLVAFTSQVDPIFSNKGWRKNAAGFYVNSAFGFGLLDASGLVEAADPKTWESVPKDFECTVDSSKSSNLPREMKTVEGNTKMLEVEVHSSGCEGQENEINFLEHVVLNISLSYTNRGDLSVYLVSPSNTTTMLLSERRIDHSDNGFDNWGLMSVHTWGESPVGTWKVIFMDKTGHNNKGAIKKVALTMYGTKTKPNYMEKGPRVYDFNYNEVQNEKRTSKLENVEEPVKEDNTHESFMEGLLRKVMIQKLVNALEY